MSGEADHLRGDIPALSKQSISHLWGLFHNESSEVFYYGEEGNDPHEEARQHLLLLL